MDEYPLETFRALLDTAPDPMVVVDDAGVVVYVNIRIEQVFGYRRAELLGKKVEVLIPARLRGTHSSQRAEFAAQPTSRSMGSRRELFACRRDGSEFPVEVSLSPLDTPRGRLVSACLRDISERSLAEAELREARELAESASSAKSDFLSSMSHELRTPLNAILGFAQLLERDRKFPLIERHRERIAHILKGGEHLLRLIDDVLDLSGIESGRIMISLEPVVLADILAEVKAILDPMALRADIELVVGPVSAELLVIADRTRLKQILMNYGSNAVKYGRARGMASFSTSKRHDRMRVSVVDDGVGIAVDKQDRIFQPFFRAGQETGPIEGTGIGLALSRRLAELMGAEVGFGSTPGHGSEFWVQLPLHQPDASVPANEPAGAPARFSALGSPDGPHYLVVYIEDNPSNIAFMDDLLTDFERVHLVTAPTAEIGIELVRARQPDVVVMDLNLPGMSGVEAAARLKQWPETQTIPVVALTAVSRQTKLGPAAHANFHRYLTKPVNVDELAQTLEELLVSPVKSERS